MESNATSGSVSNAKDRMPWLYDENGKHKGGRPVGTTNAMQLKVRAELATTVGTYFTSGKFTEDLSKLSPGKRIDAVSKMLPYIAATYKQIEVTGEINNKITTVQVQFGQPPINIDNNDEITDAIISDDEE